MLRTLSRAMAARVRAHAAPNPARDASYLPEVDGLRAVAALAAVVYHYSAFSPAPTLEWFRAALAASPAAVDTFFIISGFLIGGVLLRHKDSTTYYQTFYIRRALRILPIYYVFVAGYLLLHFTLSGWGASALQWQSSLLLVTSLVFLFQNLLPLVVAGSWVIGPTWTLAVEEHFYLVGPACVRWLSTRRLVHVLIGVVVLSPIFRAVLFRFIGHSGHWYMLATGTWTMCRADALAFGVLAAVAWRSPKWRAWICDRTAYLFWGAVIFTVAGLLLVGLGAAGIPYTLTLTVAFDRTVAELSSLSFFLLVLATPQSRCGAFLRVRIMQHLGRISYCLYLVHWGVLWVLYRFALRIDFGDSPWLGLIIGPPALAISILIAQLSWKYLENPLILRGRQFQYGAATSRETRADVRPVRDDLQRTIA